MKLTLIRHTSLQVASGICYGQTDLDVAASFAQEAANTQSKLENLFFDATFSSPLQRCAKLAEALTLGNIAYDARLKELHFGDWEMQAWENIPRETFDHWAQNYAHLAPPNGETFAQLQARGVAFIDEMLPLYANGHIAVITHGGMIRAMIAHALNIPLKGLFRFHVDYGSISQLDFSGSVPNIKFVNR